jgi:hypothetical protein
VTDQDAISRIAEIRATAMKNQRFIATHEVKGPQVFHNAGCVMVRLYPKGYAPATSQELQAVGPAGGAEAEMTDLSKSSANDHHRVEMT